MNLNRLTILTIAITMLGGCSTINRLSANVPGVYRIDIDQGNRFDQTKVDQLTPGMAKRQVAFLLGTPMVEDMFNQGQWDYIYHLKTGSGEITTQRISLFFDEEQLTRISGDLRPNPADSDVPKPEQKAYVVPPQKDERGLFTKAVDKVTGTITGDEEK